MRTFDNQYGAFVVLTQRRRLLKQTPVGHTDGEISAGLAFNKDAVADDIIGQGQPLNPIANLQCCQGFAYTAVAFSVIDEDHCSNKIARGAQFINRPPADFVGEA
jgi:hypothetical protein